MKLSIDSESPEKTEKIAKSIGQKLIGGEVIELNSELGGGKTTFTRGLVSAIDTKDNVASPTFTISRLYNGKKLDVYHFDFYRLADPGLIEHELADVIDNKKNVVVIEWPDVMDEALPKERLKVEFEVIDQNSRKLLFTYPESLSYLMSNYVDTSNQN